MSDKPPHALIQLLQAFKNPFVMVLIVLGLVSYVMDVLMAEPGDGRVGRRLACRRNDHDDGVPRGPAGQRPERRLLDDRMGVRAADPEGIDRRAPAPGRATAERA